MTHSKLRRQIAWEAARLMYFREESEYYRAKMKAARSVHRGWVHPSDLPSNAEIRDEVRLYARMLEGASHEERLKSMRFEAYWLMAKLERFAPRLIGSVLTGHIRQGSDIDLHVFSDRLEPITSRLDEEYMLYDIEKKQVRKNEVETTYTHIHVKDRFPFELTVYGWNMRSYGFTSSITGKPIEKASLSQLQQLLKTEYPDVDLQETITRLDDQPDRYQVFATLLLPLENVKQDPRFHPEGDALYHSLQVFDRAQEQHPYDEEFLSAALMHDIGKAIDPDDHVSAALEALEGFITPRTAWLIEHHMDAHLLRDGTAGARLRKRLEQHESYQELLDLADADRNGRQSGIDASEIEDAIDYLRNLASAFG